MTEKWPEHEKLMKVKDKSQMIGDFLEWLGEQSFEISEYEECEDCGCEHLFPIRKNREQLLAEYFGIDLKVLEDEKQQMLDEVRKQNEIKDGKH